MHELMYKKLLKISLWKHHMNYRVIGKYKTYSSASSNIIFKEMNVHDNSEEFTIRVPYGNLAGKVWNKGGLKTPILALHGWLDNAGTWDNISPFLNQEYPIYAIDFPGHGLSSYPYGCVNFTDKMISIEYVFHYFKWKKAILMGHSMGGAIAMVYTGTFPEKIEKLIMIDSLKPLHIDSEDQPKRTAKGLKEMLIADDKLSTNAPRYSYDEILMKMVASYRTSISEDSAKLLLKRGACKHDDNTYSYRYSPYLKVASTLSMNIDQQKAFASNVKCDMLVIKATDGPIYEKNKNILKEFVEIYKKSCKSFTLEVLNGTHHLHLNDPSKVAIVINSFLNDIPQDKVNEELAEKYISEIFSSKL